MQKIIKKLMKFTLILTLAACAIKPVTTNDQAYREIKDYEHASQRSDLNKIIDEKPVAAKEDFLVPLYNKSVHSWIKYFSKRDKKRFERYLSNGYKYKVLIENIFASYELPKDLFYVGLIESGYYLNAKSKASAVGPWQFIKSTAKRYNLSVNSKVDERRSIIKSTHAAAKYFQDLYNIFGSWELALAAYNAGEYGVIRRIRGANTRDFHKLSKMKKLPRETRNYVPKVLAAMEVAKNYKRYSVKIPRTKTTIFDNIKKVNLKGNYSLRTLSKSYRVSIKTIKDLNNDIKKGITPFYPRDGYNLYLPKSTRSVSLAKVKKHKVLKRKISSAKTKRVKAKKVKRVAYKTKTHRVRKGENLYSIARKYHISKSELTKANKIKGSKIIIGQRLKVPRTKATVHTVKKGEYLLKIAKNYGTTLSRLRKLNNRSFNRLLPGQKIIISYN